MPVQASMRDVCNMSASTGFANLSVLLAIFSYLSLDLALLVVCKCAAQIAMFVAKERVIGT